MSPEFEIKHLGIESNRGGLLHLNNLSAKETSLLSSERFNQLIQWSSVSRFIPSDAALLLAFDQYSHYDGRNYLWFRERFQRFLYIDRVIVAQDYRRFGMGRALYAEVFSHAAKLGQSRIACEVNLVTSNLASDEFHARLGFKEVGRATLDNVAKTVRYPVAELPRAFQHDL